ERELPPQLKNLPDGFELSRQRHTFARLPSEAGRRLLVVAHLLPGWVAVAFAIAGLAYAPLWPASIFAAAFFLLQLTFHFRASIYYLEMVPWLCLAAASGVEFVVRGIRRLRRPLDFAAAVVAGLAGVWVAVG